MKAISKTVLLLASLCLFTTIGKAQSYTYAYEGFEENAWSTAGNNVTSSTGRWTTNKNTHSTEQIHEGDYSLKLSAKNGIITPELVDGAGWLIYYAHVTNRQVNVEVSADGNSWTRIESYKVTTEWTKHTVRIKDKDVRYVKISSTSNNQLYIDDIVVTRADGTLADGSKPVPDIDVTYFTQDFETNGVCPSSKEECSTEKAIEVEGQGQWLYLNAYKGTNTSYISDGSARDLRMLKNGSYVVTPILELGVAQLHFQEGRTGKELSVYGSTDGGKTWILLDRFKTQKDNTLEIYRNDLNRIKIANESSSDADVDNITVTGFPVGTPATVETGEASEIGSSKAKVSGRLIDKGDRPMIEWGICWSYLNEPSYEDHKAKADSEEYTVQLTGIDSESTIYYRAYALSLAGIAYGDVKTLTTLAPTVATVITDQPMIDEMMQDEQHIYLKLSAHITDNGGIAPDEAGFCFNTTGDPTISDNVVTTYIYGDDFTKSIALQPQTTYYIRAYVKNKAGVGYSETIEYTTSQLIVPEYPHNVYYLSTDGDDTTADGTKQAPYYSLHKAVERVEAGDTIIIEAGTYQYSTRINMQAIGKPGSGMIVVKAEGGRAVLDFSAMSLGDNNQGIRLTGSYWHIYGIDICNAGDNGMLIERNKPSGGNYNDVKDRTHEAHDNLIENCRFYRNRDTGLQMKNLAEYNKVINCDSYFNADPDYEDADGFAVKVSHGTGNYFYGCRAWGNCDDGWDGFVKTDGGFPDDCTTTYENCWAFMNGYLEDGATTSDGDGNGFKLGSANGAHNAILNRCLAFENYQKGFDQNHNSGSMIFNNCTGFALPLTSNSSHYTYRIDEPVSAGHEVRFTNCVAVSDGISDRKKSAFAPYSISGNNLTITTCDFNTLPEDYQSIDPKAATSERDEIGNLPEITFMHIADGNTKLIDKGTPVIPYPGENPASVGILYNGTAPDLGCFETDGENGIIDITANTAQDRMPLKVTRTASGLMIVEVEGASADTLYTIIATDVTGRQLAAHTFYGAITTVNVGKANGIVILTVVSERGKGSVKVKSEE